MQKNKALSDHLLQEENEQFLRNNEVKAFFHAITYKHCQTQRVQSTVV